MTGHPGTGKTSTIKCLAKDIFKDYYKECVIELNASDNRGLETINILMAKILGFYITPPISKRSFLKILYLLSIGLLTQFKSRGARSKFIFKSDTEGLEKDFKKWDSIELRRAGVSRPLLG